MIKKIVVGFHHKYPSQNYCYYVLQCKPDISRSCISRNWIYRGRMLDPIFLPIDFANLADRDIFHEIAVPPCCIQFVGDNFSRNLFTAIAFVPVFAGDNFSRNQLEPTCQCGLEHMLCESSMSRGAGRCAAHPGWGAFLRC